MTSTLAGVGTLVAQALKVPAMTSIHTERGQTSRTAVNRIASSTVQRDTSALMVDSSPCALVQVEVPPQEIGERARVNRVKDVVLAGAVARPLAVLDPHSRRKHETYRQAAEGISPGTIDWRERRIGLIQSFEVHEPIRLRDAAGCRRTGHDRTSSRERGIDDPLVALGVWVEIDFHVRAALVISDERHARVPGAGIPRIGEDPRADRHRVDAERAAVVGGTDVDPGGVSGGRTG